MRKATPIVILVIAIIITTSQFKALVETVSAAGDSESEFETVAVVLSQIESGRIALAQMEQYGVEVKFETGGGTYYLASDNKMVIDGSPGAQRAALSFIHEMTHARYHHEGQRVNIGESSKEFYIQGRIQEEAEGVIRSIEAKKELAETGSDVSQLHYPLEKAYTEAYLAAQNVARARERGISSTELESIGQAAGLARVIQGFVNGEVLGSKRLSSYAETYGDCWSTANTLGGLVAVVGKALSAEVVAELLRSVNDNVSGTC